MIKWETVSVASCLEPLKLPADKVQTKYNKISGTFPIVDQGRDLVAGWTDNRNGLIDSPLPLIVFGDHTRILKYIDFPFVRGADGTQILYPDGRFDPHFFYFACKALDIESRGYNRHFSILKEREIPIPPKEEQEWIGKILALIESQIDDEQRTCEITIALKHTAMHELFTRGLRGEAQKETEIGLVPESWEICRLGDHFKLSSGGTPSRHNSEYWDSGTIPWVKTTEIDYKLIITTEECITQKGLSESAAKILPAGTLLMAMYGQGVTRGKVAILGIDAACNQACAAIMARDDIIFNQYLYHFFSYQYEQIRKLAHGGQQQNLNLEIVRTLAIAFPPTPEQREIVEILDAIDRKIELHKKKKALLEELFKSLLHKLMTGKIRVADLDLSAIGKIAD
jgi:type I restriction enzyme S subunit